MLLVLALSACGGDDDDKKSKKKKAKDVSGASAPALANSGNTYGATNANTLSSEWTHVVAMRTVSTGFTTFYLNGIFESTTASK